jgi:DNA-binding GntR family transcriptional regulator
VARTSVIIMLYEQPGRVGCAVDEHAALIDLIEKGNVAGAVAATNHHLDAIEERLMVEAPPAKLAIDFRTLLAAAE